MPALSVMFIRISFTYLLAGFVLGALLLAHKGIPWLQGMWTLLPLHIEFMLFGWVIQFIMGVAYWMMPRLDQTKERGNETVALTAFLLMNAGLLVSGFGRTLDWSDGVVLAGRLAELSAAILFLVHAWPRVRAFGS